MHMEMHLLVKKSAQNVSIKGELEEALDVASEVHLRFRFKKHKKLQKKNVK